MLPLLFRKFSSLLQEGFKTIGFDIDEEKVNRLNNNKTYIKNIAKKNIKLAVKAGFFATTDFSQISTVDNISLMAKEYIDVYKHLPSKGSTAQIRDIQNQIFFFLIDLSYQCYIILHC